MLKIGTLRWRGRCSRHPDFDPSDGASAIRGECPRCQALLDIYIQHRRLLQMMRDFGQMRDRPRKVAERQLQRNLFD
jgi:hypothetical protein